MRIEFTVNDASCGLEVQVDGKALPLIIPASLWLSDREEVLSYMRGVADRLNELLAAGRVEEVAALLGQADRHIHPDPCTEDGEHAAEFAETVG